MSNPMTIVEPGKGKGEKEKNHCIERLAILLLKFAKVCTGGKFIYFICDVSSGTFRVIRSETCIMHFTGDIENDNVTMQCSCEKFFILDPKCVTRHNQCPDCRG